MNLALSEYADNPIIDRLVQWPPRKQKIIQLRGSAPVLRNPFIEIDFENNRTERYSFSKSQFSQYWAEAKVILNTLTDINIVSEVRYQPDVSEHELVADILQTKSEAIDESMEIFNAGMYRVFLEQFGENCKELPPEVEQCIATARMQKR